MATTATTTPDKATISIEVPNLDATKDPNAAAKLHDLPDLWRPFFPADVVHYTVKPEARCRQTPAGCSVESEADELVAQAVGAGGLEADAPLPKAAQTGQ